MANNFNIGVNFSGNLGNLPSQAAAAAASLNGVGAAAQAAGAGLTGLSGATTAAAASLNRLSPAARPSLTGLTLLGSASSTAATGLGATTAAAQQAAAALSRVRPGANQAGAALTNVGRVAQDLPFGFIGIQNNLNPLLESFQRLRIETGSNRLALRALGSSLIGAGGIGLALSVVSSAIVIFQNGIAGFNRKTKEAADKTKEFVDSLKSVSDIAGNAAGGVQGQIAQVQALASVVTNTNNTYKERSAALRELQQINKSYFGDLKLEESQMGLLAARANEYTQALVAQAVVKGFSDEISRVAVELDKQQKALSSSAANLIKLQDALKKTKQSETSLTGEDRISQKYINAKNAVNDAERAFIEQGDAVRKIQVNYKDLTTAIQSAVQKNLQFRDLTSATTSESKKEADALKQRIAALKELQGLTGLAIPQQIELAQLEIKLASRDAVKNGIKPEELNQQIEGILEKAFPVRTFEFDITPVLKIKTVQAGGPIDVAGAVGPIPEGAFDGIIDAIRKQAEAAQEALGKSIRENFINNTAVILQDAIMESAGLLGETLGNLFSGGGFGESLAMAGEALLGIIGGVLQEVGKYVIITSQLVEKLKVALAGLFTNPVAGIAVGLGLIALGGLLKNIKLPGFAEGTRNFGGGLALVGENGPEVVRLRSGSDVIPNHLLGVGGQSLQVYGRIRGEDIYLSNNRVTQRRGRI